MKLGVLRSIAHNIADSVGCGMGLMIGLHTFDIYGEAAVAPEGYIEVDFLTGDILLGQHSHNLAQAIKRYAEVLPALCERSGVKVENFKSLVVRFYGKGVWSGFTVLIEDQSGRSSVDDFWGSPARKLKALDRLGRGFAKHREHPRKP